MGCVEFGDTVVNGLFDLLDPVSRNHSGHLGRNVLRQGRAEKSFIGVVEGEHSAIERVCNGFAIRETARKADREWLDWHGDGLVTVRSMVEAHVWTDVLIGEQGVEVRVFCNSCDRQSSLYHRENIRRSMK